MGFPRALPAGTQRDEETALLRLMIPDDLMRFGMIPELVGRLPVTAVVTRWASKPAGHPDRAAQRADAPIPAAVRNGSCRPEIHGRGPGGRPAGHQAGHGARGLRAIIEDTLLDIMYEIPSHPEIARVTLEADCIIRKAPPSLLNRDGQDLDLDQDQPLPDAA